MTTSVCKRELVAMGVKQLASGGIPVQPAGGAAIVVDDFDFNHACRFGIETAPRKVKNLASVNVFTLNQFV